MAAKRAAKLLRENPDTRLVKVAYSRTQRQKRDYRTSADCLLKEVLDNELARLRAEYIP